MNPSVAFPAARTENHSVAEPMAEMPDPDKCSRQHVPVAVRIAKFPSNPGRASRSIAANVSTQ